MVKNNKRKPASTHSLTKKIYPGYTIDELKNMTISRLSEFVGEHIRIVRCPICDKWGKLIASGVSSLPRHLCVTGDAGIWRNMVAVGEYIPTVMSCNTVSQSGKNIRSVDITLTSLEKMETTSAEEMPTLPTKSTKRSTIKGPRESQVPTAPK